MCNEIKLNKQIKRHSLNEGQQLGEFCEQFTLNIPKVPSHDRRPKKENNYRKWKEMTLEKRSQRKKAYKEKKGFIKSDKPNACYKCGRLDHYAKDCKVKENIKSLNIDENIKD